MPITSSAKKAYRASLVKKTYNDRRKRAVRDVLKDIKKLILEKKTTEASLLLPQAYKAIDKATKGNTLKKNTAARKKARLTKFVQKNAQ